MLRFLTVKNENFEGTALTSRHILSTINTTVKKSQAYGFILYLSSGNFCILRLKNLRTFERSKLNGFRTIGSRTGQKGTRSNGSQTNESGLGHGNNCPGQICPGPICPRIKLNSVLAF